MALPACPTRVRHIGCVPPRRLPLGKFLEDQDDAEEEVEAKEETETRGKFELTTISEIKRECQWPFPVSEISC